MPCWGKGTWQWRAHGHLQNVRVWSPQEIRRDAFWLQRRVSSTFGSLDAAEAQQLAEKIFRTLKVKLRSSVPLHVLGTATCGGPAA